jgi:beta-glucanase (GH16 family)
MGGSPRSASALTALAAAAVLGFAAPASAAPAVSVPVAVPAAARILAAASAASWKLSYATDFNGTSLPSRTFTYGSAYEGGASHWAEDHVRVSGGLLHLVMDEQDTGGKPYTSGGMGFSVGQTYGRYEWRAKVPVGKGIDSYATLWPDGSGDSDALLMEALGTPGAEKMAITNLVSGGKHDTLIGGPFADGFHTYAIEWAPGSTRVLMDGAVRFTDARAASVRRTIQFAMVTGDNYSGLPDANTVFPAEFQVDWVRIYSYVPEAAAPTTPAPTRAPRTASPAPTTPVPAAAPTPPVTVATATDAEPHTAADGVSPKRPWVWTALGALIAVLAAGVARITWQRRRSG